MSENVIYALLLTLFAGLSTGIGSFFAFFTKRSNTKFLSISLGFSAGVMIYVSLVEIFFKAKESLIAASGSIKMGTWYTVLGFFGGILLIGIIDKLIPSAENPHEIKSTEDFTSKDGKKPKLMRMGIMTALAIAIHNFPEGIATFLSVIEDPEVGLIIAIAIAIHNIPEGIAVSVPVYYATGSKKKAFLYSFLSGLSEPVGAFLAYLILMPFLASTPLMFGIIFSSVAGIMVFISIDELLPTASKYGKHHYSIYGFVAGMAVMAISLVLLS